MSSRRDIAMDGKSIHLSKVARGNTKFEYSWPMKGGNHVLKIIAHGTPPMGEQSYKQFDLELDGMSYFTFAKIYELGNNIGRKSSSGRCGSRALTVATHSAPIPQSYDYRGMAYDVRDDAEYEVEEETAPMSTVTYGNFSKIGMSSKNGSISSPIFTAVISLPVIITPFSSTLWVLIFFCLGKSIFHCNFICSKIFEVSLFDIRFDFKFLCSHF